MAQTARTPPGCGHVDKPPVRGQRGYTLPTARRLAHMPTAEQPFYFLKKKSKPYVQRPVPLNMTNSGVKVKSTKRPASNAQGDISTL
jgi:hypothetical protein